MLTLIASICVASVFPCTTLSQHCNKRGKGPFASNIKFLIAEVDQVNEFSGKQAHFPYDCTALLSYSQCIRDRWLTVLPPPSH